MSPGSRNAPLLVALERQPQIDTYMVIDERSAGFIALGMADASGEPVALVCTSGTAPLNYGPAVAEAFYRNVPLIVITADRPYEWIDQDDSQTIIQPGIYANFIKGTFDISVDSVDADRQWYVNRTLNDALALALDGRPGPVHINVRISEPVGATIEVGNESVRKIETDFRNTLPTDAIAELASEINSGRKVLILAGFMHPQSIAEPLARIAQMPNVIVMHEAQSNLHGVCSDFIPNIDATLTCLPEGVADPDLVVTIGGSLTSRMIKARLRKNSAIRHWSVGMNQRAVDCFRHMERRICAPAADVVVALAEQIVLPPNGATSSKPWLEASKRARNIGEQAQTAPWSDFKAMHYLMQRLPAGCNLHLSNGTAVRYAQLFDYQHLGHIFCNRGVSGIDGCTSTAIGAAVASQAPSVLISGDMSFQYDLGALATTFIPSTFKMVVLNNDGGGIFRFIAATRHLDEVEKCFAGPVNLPLEAISKAYGFTYFAAESFAALPAAVDAWLAANDAPAVLEIKTDGQISAETIRNFFKV